MKAVHLNHLHLINNKKKVKLLRQFNCCAYFLLHRVVCSFCVILYIECLLVVI